MRPNFFGFRKRPLRLGMLVGGIILLAVIGLAVWHWYPGGKSEATPAMRQAMEKMLQGVQVSPSPPAPSAHPTTERQHLIASAWKLLGVPYQYGAKGPDKLDCSGFTKAAYKGIGINLPDGSFNQAKGEQPLTSLAALAPGDLLLYRWAGHSGVSHVTMYAGGGWVIGTGTPGQPGNGKVSTYPITDDLKTDGRVITYRHITLSDEH